MRHWKIVKNLISFSFDEPKVRQVFLIEFNYFPFSACLVTAKKCICVGLPPSDSRKDEPLDVNLRLFILENHPSASPLVIFSVYTLSQAAGADA